MQLSASELVGGMISGPLASILMHRSPWVAMVASFCLIAASNLVTLVLPETLDIQRREDAHDAAAAAALDADTGEAEESRRTKLQQLWTTCKGDVREVYDFVLKNQRTTFLLLSLVFIILGEVALQLLLQYATARYQWSWDKAAILVAIRSASTLLLLAVILPAISWLCVNKLKMTGVAKDLWLARISAVVQTLGGLLLAFSVNGAMFVGSLVVYAGGGGLTSLIRSLANALVEEHHVGILNSLVGFLEMVGIMVAGPLLAKSMELGLRWQGLWIGLPFMVSAFLFAISTLIVWTFRVPKLLLSDVLA